MSLPDCVAFIPETPSPMEGRRHAPKGRGMGGGRAGVTNRVRRARPGLRLPNTSTIDERKDTKAPCGALCAPKVGLSHPVTELAATQEP